MQACAEIHPLSKDSGTAQLFVERHGNQINTKLNKKDYSHCIGTMH